MSSLSDELPTRRTEGHWLPEIPVEPLSARYQIMGEPIGRGGFGVVYRAKKLQLPQQVAVKRLQTEDSILPSLSDQQRFVREVTLAASLKHPNIVGIQAWGRDHDGLYVVMDLVEGGSLQKLVEGHGPVPVGKLLRYARQICLALQEAHKSGILHRDLKPANMLLDRFGNVQLADFGLARSSSANLTTHVKSSGVLMYTYAYASPEQIVGEPLDARSDLFSLGATLYHLAKGTPAYDRDFDLEGISEDLHALLSSLLKRKRDQRPATVDEVLEQLNELQENRVAAQVPKRVSLPTRQMRPHETTGVPAEAPNSETPSRLPSVEIDASRRRNADQSITVRTPTRWRRKIAIATVLVVMWWMAVAFSNRGWKSVFDQRMSAQKAMEEEVRNPGPAPTNSASPPQNPADAAASAENANPANMSSKMTALSPGGTSFRADTKADPPQKPVDSPTPAASVHSAASPELLRAPFSAAAAMEAQTAWASYLKRTVQWQDPFGQEFRLIPPGEYQMGSDETADQLEQAEEYFFGKELSEELREDIKSESPRHRVRITQPFYFGVSSVTRGQFASFVRATGYRTEAETDNIGGWGYVESEKTEQQKPEFTWRNTGFEQTDDHPVVNVTWNDVQAYVKWLNDASAKSANSGRYRLPREAEWEYVCRAGTTTRFFTGDTTESLSGFANVPYERIRKVDEGFEATPISAFDDGSPFTSPVERYSRNPFGLHDIHGNVWTWCQDWYDPNYYRQSPADDPQGPPSGVFRVARGGSWDANLLGHRSSYRGYNTPNARNCYHGCRLCVDFP